MHRYVSTNRRCYAQKPLHRAAFTRRYSYTERFVHKKTLYTDAFTHRGFYAKKEVFTQMFCTKMLLRAKIKTYWRFYTQNLCHREAFAQNSLYTLHMFFLRKKTFDTEKLVHRDCTQKFLQTDFFTRRNFTQSSFYTA